jgi:dTDP-4-dehydrorhamnose reductase
MTENMSNMKDGIKKVLILGGSGMLGHKLWQICGRRFPAYVALRRDFASYRQYGLFDKARSIDHVSAEGFESVARAIAESEPDVVVNCIGIVKQAEVAKDPLSSIQINALLPHRLAQLCSLKGVRLIHISTDCVFSGLKGNYTEDDASDAEDLYGRTKFLGEVGGAGCLTLRTSMIGRELETSHGLIEWFLSQQGKTVRGYKRAIFSGFTTIAIAEIIARLIAEHPDLHGVWHVASKPITKYDLLELVREVYGFTIEIEPDESVVCDRSLNSDRFRRATGLVAPAWPDMIMEMYRDPTPYSELRRRNAKQDPE